MRPSLSQLERRAQKHGHRRVGNWLARRVARPVALRVTWIVAPWGVSAHAVTLVATITALAAAAAFGLGNVGGWILGAMLLQLWYLLDHVDGQLARLNETASLDGTTLDYLMHHTVTMSVPLGIGMGLFSRTCEAWWLVVGMAWSVAWTLVGLRNDARYKAYFQRLKLVDGALLVMGRANRAPMPTNAPKRHALATAWWLARKACEAHVALCVLTAVAVAQWLSGDENLWLARIALASQALVAFGVAAAALARDTSRGEAERDFANWFRPRPCESLVFEDGRYRVVSDSTVARGR